MRFREAAALGEEDIAAVQHAVRKRVLRLLERRGLLASEAAAEVRQWGTGLLLVRRYGTHGRIVKGSE